MRSFVQLFRAAKGIWVDPDATEGAVVGENLFIRLDDGTLALFQPPAGTVVAADGTTVAVTLNAAANARARRKSRSVSTRSVNGSSLPATGGAAGLSHTRQVVPGSNSGYLPTFNPTTPQSGFDLDPWMVSGLPPALNPYPSVPDTAHGFIAGNIVRLNGTDYVKAQANNAVNAEAVGMVAGIDDANNFRICSGGRVKGFSGLVPGAVYFLSATTAGAMSLTDPLVGGVVGQVSKPVFIADSATSGYFVQLRGTVVGGSAAPGSGYDLLDMTRYAVIGDDFSDTVNSGPGSKTQAVLSGTGAAFARVVDPGHPGAIDLSTGTTAAGSSRFIGPSGVAGGTGSGLLNLGNGTVECIQWFKTPAALSDAANRYQINVSIRDLCTGTSANEIGVNYLDTVNGGKFYLAVNVANPGVAPAVVANGSILVAINTWYRVRIVVNAAVNSVSVYIKVGSAAEVLDMTFSGALPASSVFLGAVFYIFKTTGVVSRTARHDGWQWKETFAAER